MKNRDAADIVYNNTLVEVLLDLSKGTSTLQFKSALIGGRQRRRKIQQNENMRSYQEFKDLSLRFLDKIKPNAVSNSGVEQNDNLSKCVHKCSKSQDYSFCDVAKDFSSDDASRQMSEANSKNNAYIHQHQLTVKSNDMNMHYPISQQKPIALSDVKFKASVRDPSVHCSRSDFPINKKDSNGNKNEVIDVTDDGECDRRNHATCDLLGENIEVVKSVALPKKPEILNVKILPNNVVKKNISCRRLPPNTSPITLASKNVGSRNTFKRKIVATVSVDLPNKKPKQQSDVAVPIRQPLIILNDIMKTLSPRQKHQLLMISPTCVSKSKCFSNPMFGKVENKLVSKKESTPMFDSSVQLKKCVVLCQKL